MSEQLYWVRPDDPCGICGQRVGREVWELMGTKGRPEDGIVVVHRDCMARKYPKSAYWGKRR